MSHVIYIYIWSPDEDRLNDEGGEIFNNEAKAFSQIFLWRSHLSSEICRVSPLTEGWSKWSRLEQLADQSYVLYHNENTEI